MKNIISTQNKVKLSLKSSLILKGFLVLFYMIGLPYSCADLEEVPFSELTPNNFFQNKENVEACHYYKTQKESIPQNKRTQCWKRYYGEETEGECPISYCNTVIRTGKGGTQIGHIISEKNGGKIELNNLRPICKKCNCEMGTLNWEDFDLESFNSCIRL